MTSKHGGFGIEMNVLDEVQVPGHKSCEVQIDCSHAHSKQAVSLNLQGER